MRSRMRKIRIFMLTVGASLALSLQAFAQTDPLPSWTMGLRRPR